MSSFCLSSCLFLAFRNIRMTSPIILFQFLGVLNSKKAKLRELRDRLSKQEKSEKLPEEEEDEESTDKTETFDGSDDEKSEEESTVKLTGTSKNVSSIKPRGRKRK